MDMCVKADVDVVHCRIGSLENSLDALRVLLDVHCRIGSLEMISVFSRDNHTVHCRIGSLETHERP